MAGLRLISWFVFESPPLSVFSLFIFYQLDFQRGALSIKGASYRKFHKLPSHLITSLGSEIEVEGQQKEMHCGLNLYYQRYISNCPTTV